MSQFLRPQLKHNSVPWSPFSIKRNIFHSKIFHFGKNINFWLQKLKMCLVVGLNAGYDPTFKTKISSLAPKFEDQAGQ